MIFNWYYSYVNTKFEHRYMVLVNGKMGRVHDFVAVYMISYESYNFITFVIEQISSLPTFHCTCSCRVSVCYYLMHVGIPVKLHFYIFKLCVDIVIPKCIHFSLIE